MLSDTLANEELALAVRLAARTDELVWNEPTDAGAEVSYSLAADEVELPVTGAITTKLAVCNAVSSMAEPLLYADGAATIELLEVVDGAMTTLPVLDNELSFCADEAPEMDNVPEIALNSWH